MTAGESFFPTGGTQSLAVTATSQVINLPAFGNPSRDLDVFVAGTQAVFLKFGQTGSAPTADTTTCLPVAAGQRIKLTVPANYRDLAVVAASTGSTVYVTPGNGN